MKRLPMRAVFDMTAQQLKEYLRPFADKEIKEIWRKGSYLIYFDERLCQGIDTMIHEYKNRKELVQLDEKGKAKFIKLINCNAVKMHNINPEK